MDCAVGGSYTQAFYSERLVTVVSGFVWERVCAYRPLTITEVSEFMHLPLTSHNYVVSMSWGATQVGS